MARKITYSSVDLNLPKQAGPYPVCRVWAYGSIEIERIVSAPRDRFGFVHRAKRAIRYSNISKASEGRLHKVVSKLINKNQASIEFIHGTLGLGYEVEL